MHTNFDALAHDRMAEHDAYAARSVLQRQAREARRTRAESAGVSAAWEMATRSGVLEVAVLATVAGIAFLG